jgi:hypothetical protein
MKQVIVTFNYDPETDTVSDVQCSIDGVEKKRKTTRKVKDVIEEMSSIALVTLEPNKLVFNNKAVADMGLEYEDRIVIKWEKRGKQMIPIIGKDLAFNEEGTGNKVTKANTITYKGKANLVLADYGTEFTLSQIGEGIWELVSNIQKSEDTTLESVIEDAIATEPDLLVTTDKETVIDKLTFQL